MKNRLLKFVTTWANKLIIPHHTQNQILIVSTTALGDTLWTTPAIANIRKSFPNCYLAVLTSQIGKEVLENNPHIDKLFILKEPLSKHFFSLWKRLYKERFDTVLLMHASQRLTLPLSATIGAKRIVATTGLNKGLDSLLTHPMPNHAQHEITRRLKIAEAIGAKTVDEIPSFFLKPEELLPKRDKGPWIAIHPGSKDAFKRWPAEYFIKLGKLLKEHFSCKILITGSANERELMKRIAAQIPGAQIDEPNRSLRSFAALLHQMDLLISNDTGPFHLASALNTPVVGIYSSTDPALCGPHKAPNATIVSRRAACDPCLKRKCRQPFCFLQISPNEVFQKITELELFKTN